MRVKDWGVPFQLSNVQALCIASILIRLRSLVYFLANATGNNLWLFKAVPIDSMHARLLTAHLLAHPFWLVILVDECKLLVPHTSLLIDLSPPQHVQALSVVFGSELCICQKRE